MPLLCAPQSGQTGSKISSGLWRIAQFNFFYFSRRLRLRLLFISMVHGETYFPKKRILNSFLLKLSGLAIFFFIAVGSYLLENNFLFEKRKIFYVPPANYLKVICGSFRSLCAGLFYIRGVLAVTQTGEFKNRGDWANWVQKNFEAALTLDPKLTQGYFFAGIVIVRDKPEEIKKGIAFLEGLAQSVKDPEQLKWIEIKLKWFKNIVELEGKVEQFRRLYGYAPLDLEKLIEAGLLKEIPADPFGVGYYIDKDSGRVKSKVGKPTSLEKSEK